MRKVPTFKTEDAERKYWASHSAAQFIDALPPVEIEVVTQRRERGRIALDTAELEAIKKVARRKKMPYQELMRTWLLERLRNESAARTVR